jgi:hypothetical protein
VARRGEFNLLTIRGLSDGDGLKLPTGVASVAAGQSQGSYKQEEEQSAVLIHSGTP